MSLLQILRVEFLLKISDEKWKKTAIAIRKLPIFITTTEKFIEFID